MNRTKKKANMWGKGFALYILLIMCTTQIYAQTDSTFCGKFIDAENNTYLVLDLDSQHVVVPGQEFFGEMAGYLGQKNDSRVWFITSAERISKNKATVYITNDYGSEDLEATLTCLPDGRVVLKQGSGSRIKIVVNRKWQKIPTETTYVREQKNKASGGN